MNSHTRSVEGERKCWGRRRGEGEGEEEGERGQGGEREEQKEGESSYYIIATHL